MKSPFDGEIPMNPPSLTECDLPGTPHPDLSGLRLRRVRKRRQKEPKEPTELKEPKDHSWAQVWTAWGTIDILFPLVD